MSRFFFIVVGGALLFSPLSGAVRAQDITPSAPVPTPVTEPEISLDDLVRRALGNNPQLPAARQTQEAARLRAEALRARSNPTLQLIPGIGNREARDEEVILAQPLDVFGKRRARAGVAQAELRRAQAETTLAERALVVAVKNAAAELFAAQEAESLGRTQVEIAGQFRAAAARKAELGDVPQVQVQRAELELLRAQNDLSIAHAERLGRRAALNQLIGQAPETPLRVALPIATSFTDLLRLPISVSRPNAAPDSSLLAPSAPASGGQIGGDFISQRAPLLVGALANRPDIQGAQATLEGRRATIQSLRRERKPDIELQARRSSFFGREGSYALRAVVTIPVFDFGSLRAQRRAAEAEVKAQESQITLLKGQAATQVEQALVKLDQQRQTIERFRLGIVPLTVELLRKTQIGYQAGASTYLEVLEAQRTLRQVQTEYLQALVGVRAGETALESALGAVPPTAFMGTLVNLGAPAMPPGNVISPNILSPLNDRAAPNSAPQGGQR